MQKNKASVAFLLVLTGACTSAFSQTAYVRPAYEYPQAPGPSAPANVQIGNVLGVAGVQYMLENGAKTPFKFYFGAPSCVPATTFETAGATISVAEVKALLDDERIVYLSEMMNFPGVLGGDPECLAKIRAAQAARR